MRKVIEEHRKLSASIEGGGEESARKRHLSKGKLLPRDRLNNLLDVG